MSAKQNPLIINRRAWDNIGEGVVSPYYENPRYRTAFNAFCSSFAQGSAILDLGCGPGVPCTRELVRRGFRVTGVDFSTSMIEAAKTNVPTADFVQMSFLDMAFREEFDGVFASYSLLCLDPLNFGLAAQRAAAALRPGGMFFVALNEADEPGSGNAEFEEIMGQTMYTRSYSESELRKVFSGLDLRIQSIARDVITTAEYGTEKMLILLMQKD